MKKIKIEEYPSKILSTPSSFIDVSDTDSVDDVYTKLKAAYETLPDNRKVGLAAPQIGINKNMAIVLGNFCMNMEFRPANQIDIAEEGCFSINDGKTMYKVWRPKYGWAKWIDPVTQETHEEKLTGFRARVFQHEVDHINGKMCCDNK